jgi:hypothetical protein
MYRTMRIVLLAVVCAAGGMLTNKTEAALISKAALDSITQNPPLLLVQGYYREYGGYERCGRGYDRDYRTGRCYPNSDSYRGPRYGEYGGYGRCGRGYNRDYRTGRCYPAYLENR